MTICISFISQKGGVGKSTLARALAREANEQKLTVKVADLDTQQGTKNRSKQQNKHYKTSVVMIC